jgi:hypothetical protein
MAMRQAMRLRCPGAGTGGGLYPCRAGAGAGAGGALLRRALRRAYSSESRRRRREDLSRIGEAGMHLTAGMSLISLCMVYTYTYENFFVGNLRSLVRAKKEGVTVTGREACNDGKLIHYVGRVSIGAGAGAVPVPATDPDIDINRFLQGDRQHVVKLHRTSEMRQWSREKSKEFIFNSAIPESLMNVYHKVWSNRVLPSTGSRDHINPRAMPLGEYSATAAPLLLGPFKMSSLAADSLPCRSNSPGFVAPAPAPAADATRLGRLSAAYHSPNSLILSDTAGGTHSMEKSVGDVRLKYDIVFAQQHEYSIICRQNSSGEVDA